MTTIFHKHTSGRYLPVAFAIFLMICGIAACRPICDGEEGSCLALYLEGIGRYDDLSVAIEVERTQPGHPLIRCQETMTVKGPIELPVWAKLMPDERMRNDPNCIEFSVEQIRRLLFSTGSIGDVELPSVDFLPMAVLSWPASGHIERTFRLIPVQTVKRP